jgi:hypothetical protein
MRKLFNIDQEEKNRILEMHENATKRHYLNEYSGVAFGDEQNGLKIEKVETTEQVRTGEVTPDQQKQMFNKDMLAVNEKLPIDSKTLATMASKLNGFDKSLIGNQFEEALAGVWGDDLINAFNKSMSTLGYQLGQAGGYTIMMGGRKIGDINTIPAVLAMVNDLIFLKEGLTYLAKVKAGMRPFLTDAVKQALPLLKDFSQKNQLGLA